MNRFTTAISRSIEESNWYSALFMALTMPDICARLESENNRTNGLKYAKWFDTFMGGKYSHVHPLTKERVVFMDGDACYALRCSMLHQGEADLTSQKVKSFLSSIHFTTTSGHCNRVNGILQLDVGSFCNDMCSSVTDWFETFAKDDKSKPKIESLLTVYVSQSSVLGGAVVFGSSSDSH